MTDLIKRDDALAAVDTFKRDFEQSWKVQFSADIKALPAIDPAAIREAALVSAVAKQIGEEHGWVRQERLDEALAKLTKAMAALVAEREANLWNAYNIGIERDGRWSDACMSDAEWLVAQCGLDPEFKDHDANVIKETIPTSARAVLAELEEEK